MAAAAAVPHLQAAEADHAVHHLSDAETVTEVVEGVVLVVVMDTELEKQKGAGHIEQHGRRRCAVKCGGEGGVPGSHQPSLERDGVDVEVFDQSQVVVHVFQAAQHLEEPQNPSR